MKLVNIVKDIHLAQDALNNLEASFTADGETVFKKYVKTCLKALALAQGVYEDAFIREAIREIKKSIKDNPDLPEEFVKELLVTKEQDRSLAEPFELENDCIDTHVK